MQPCDETMHPPPHHTLQIKPSALFLELSASSTWTPGTPCFRSIIFLPSLLYWLLHSKPTALHMLCHLESKLCVFHLVNIHCWAETIWELVSSAQKAKPWCHVTHEPGAQPPKKVSLPKEPGHPFICVWSSLQLPYSWKSPFHGHLKASMDSLPPSISPSTYLLYNWSAWKSPLNWAFFLLLLLHSHKPAFQVFCRWSLMPLRLLPPPLASTNVYRGYSIC